MKRIPILAAFALSLSACVQTNATMLGPTPVARARVAPDSVRIYRTPDQVRARYEEIALLNATGESNWTNESGMMQSMRKKAGGLGANGIILDAINEASAGAKVAGTFLGTGSQRKGRAVAIWVYSDTVSSRTD